MIDRNGETISLGDTVAIMRPEGARYTVIELGNERVLCVGRGRNRLTKPFLPSHLVVIR